LLDREKRAAERRINEASFPVIKTIDTYNFGAQPSVNEALVRELLRGEYLDKRENILLIGNPGTGKHTWSAPWRFPLVSRAETFASIPPPTM
jgi:DNA replication protein DnaC